MSKSCPKCLESIPDEAAHCPLCGAAIQNDGYPVLEPSPADPEPYDTAPRPSEPDDPYAPMDAAIMGHAVEAPRPVPQDSGEKYGVPVEATAFISYGFLFWSQALGRLVLVSLIPMVPMLVLGVIAAVTVPFLFAGAAAGGGMPSLDGISAGAILLGIVLLVVLIVMSIAAQAAMVLLLHDQAMHGGSRRGVWEAFVEGLRYTPTILGMTFLIGLIAAGAGGLLVAVGMGSVGGAVFLGLLALVGYGYLVVRWVSVLPAIVLDGCGVIDAFKHSAELSRGYGWSVLGGVVLFVLIGMGIGLASAVVGMIPLLGQLVNLGVNLVFAPLTASVFFSIYAGLKDAAGASSGVGANVPLRMG